jgi:hypothetical protein
MAGNEPFGYAPIEDEIIGQDGLDGIQEMLDSVMDPDTLDRDLSRMEPSELATQALLNLLGVEIALNRIQSPQLKNAKRTQQALEIIQEYEAKPVDSIIEELKVLAQKRSSLIRNAEKYGFDALWEESVRETTYLLDHLGAQLLKTQQNCQHALGTTGMKDCLSIIDRLKSQFSSKSNSLLLIDFTTPLTEISSLHTVMTAEIDY